MKTPKKTLALATALLAASAQAQTCDPHILATAPASRFTINASRGTALDKRTGLMWKRCAEGLSGAGCLTGALAYYNWGGALTAAAQSAQGGYQDWRLPNVKELASLVEQQCYAPAINLTAFPNATSDAYWSSSRYASNSAFAWFVYFGDGDSFYDRFYSFAVRLVRGGQ